MLIKSAGRFVPCDTHDPVNCLTEMGGWTCERSTYFFGNFQVVTATKQ